MSEKGYQIHTSITSYPGSERYFALCDICGKKYRKRELTLIEDKFNLQNRLLVCQKDLDKPQPQLRPFIAREYKALKLVRPEPQQYPQIPNPNSDLVPGIVTNLIAYADPLSNAIDLWWLGPFQGGSDPVTGYVIYQSWPQLSIPQVINPNTQSGSPSYQDFSTPQTAICTYQVAAINSFGTGPISAPAFYPSIQMDLSDVYICMPNGTNPVIQTGSGLNIVMGNPNG